MKRYYSYDAFRNDTRALIKKVRPFEPEAIVAVARGGYTLAHTMAEGLGVRELQSLRTELYDNEHKRDALTLCGGEIVLEEKKRVLVVDDIADSGETLAFVMEYLTKAFPIVEFRSVTLFYKKSSCYEPHYWQQEAKEWIEFFWEKDYV